MDISDPKVEFSQAHLSRILNRIPCRILFHHHGYDKCIVSKNILINLQSAIRNLCLAFQNLI